MTELDELNIENLLDLLESTVDILHELAESTPPEIRERAKANRQADLNLYRHSRGRAGANPQDEYESRLWRSTKSQPIRQWRVK